MALRYEKLVSRKSKGTKIPRYNGMNVFDVFQNAALDAVISPIPEHAVAYGDGAWNVSARAPIGGGVTEVWVSLDSEELFSTEELASVGEGSTKAIWYKMGDSSTVGINGATGYFTFNTPFTFVKIKFTGAGVGGRAILAVS